jgi:hypothetical protein
MVLNIDKNGKFIWQKIIPKKQVSLNDGGYFLSYNLAVKGTDLYFIYNGTKYKKKKSGEDSKRYARRDYLRFLTVLKLDKDGELSDKVELLDRRETKMLVVPRQGKQISDNEVMLFGKSRKYNQFGLINLE